MSLAYGRATRVIAPWLASRACRARSCLAAAGAYSGETEFLAGPVPADGGTVANLQAFTDGAPTSGQSHRVTVEDNTSTKTLLSCNVTPASSLASSCTNTGSASVPAAHYLEVKITETSGNPTDRAWRVSFRY